MPATVYRFHEGNWRARQQTADGADAAGFHRFLRQFDCLLQRLSDLHLRISLARLPLAERGTMAGPLGDAIVENLQDPCAIAGMMPDGSVVAAFLGPRDGDSVVGDEEMTARITRKFERALQAAQIESVALDDGLTVAHCWSDEIYDVPSFVLELASIHQARRAGNVVEHDSGRRQA